LPENHALRNIAAFALAGQHVLSGQVMKAARAFEEVARTSRQAGDIFATVYSLYHEAEALTAQGRLHEAATVYGETKQAATLPGGRVLPLAGFGDIGLGELRREWNDLDTAETLLRRGMVAVRPVGELAAIDGFIALARVQQAKGLGEAALNSLDTALQLVRHRGAFEPQHVIDCHRARFWLMQGHLDLVKRWMVKAETAISALPVPVAEPIALNLARAALALQKPAVALRRLGPLREPALKAGRIVNLLQILALQALAHEAQGRNRLALTSLSSALAFAEPGGFVRLFVDEGAALVPLLIKLRSARELEPGRYVGWSPDYLDKLLSAYASETPTIGGPTAAFEPLSAREQEVLRHIALGASNKQIAKALDIAPSTVKWYVQAIFGKLQVTSRTQAVARARESGLL
jgi:LuxR family maltose regulon positive regulatory protein